MIDPELLSILVCPETHKSVELANQELVNKINDQIQEGKLQNRAGQAITESLSGGLIRSDGQVLYPIRDEIPIMLIDEAIVLNEHSTSSQST